LASASARMRVVLKILTIRATFSSLSNLQELFLFQAAKTLFFPPEAVTSLVKVLNLMFVASLTKVLEMVVKMVKMIKVTSLAKEVRAAK